MKKAHGKGQGISINASGGTSLTNEWKMKLSAAAEGLPVREFVPLKVKPHPRQVEIDAFNAIPSLVH